MATFFERLSTPRQRQAQTQTQTQGTVSKWGGLGASASLKGYVSKLGRLQGDVRREMGSWLEQLQSQDSGLHPELEDVKRRVNSTLSGLESHLHQALSTAQNRLRPHPDAAHESAAASAAPGTAPSLGGVEASRRQDASGAKREANPEEGDEERAEGGVEGQTQGRGSQETGTVEHAADRGAPSAHPEPARLSQSTPASTKSSPGVTQVLTSASAPPTAASASAVAGRSPGAMGTMLADDEAHWRYTGGGSGLSGPLAPSQAGSFASPVSPGLEVTRSSSLASLRSANMRIGKAIVEEEWGGKVPASGAPTWLTTAEQQRQQEAQMLADWLADR